MNNEHIIEEVRAIAHKFVDDILAVLSLGTDTVQLAQQRLADLANVQQLVLEEEQPAPVGGWKMEDTPRKNRAWTEEEDEMIKAGQRLGLTARETGERIGRSCHAVRNRLHFLKYGSY